MDQDPAALRNYGIALEQIRHLLRLPSTSSPADIVAKVRELQFAASIPGAVLPDQQQALAPSIRVPL